MNYVFAVVVTLFLNVDSCSVSHGLVTAFGSNCAKKLVGPVRNEGHKSKNSICCAKKIGADLKVNEDAVTDSSNLVYPCLLEDYECIRSFLANNSRCIPKNTSIADPLHVDQFILVYPYCNMSSTLTNVSVEGLSQSKVLDFYYNKQTGNVVIYIEVPKLNETSPKVFFSYMRKGKETIILADFATVEFHNVHWTVIIPNMPNLRLDMADIHADMPVGDFTVGANAYNSTDPDVKASFQAFQSNIQAIQRESFLFKSQLFAALYIQEFLCDFGFDLYSV